MQATTFIAPNQAAFDHLKAQALEQHAYWQERLPEAGRGDVYRFRTTAALHCTGGLYCAPALCPSEPGDPWYCDFAHSRAALATFDAFDQSLADDASPAEAVAFFTARDAELLKLRAAFWLDTQDFNSRATVMACVSPDFVRQCLAGNPS